jgi:hypothetical protein
MALSERTAGETVFGSTRQQSTVGLNTAASTASGLVCLDTAGVEYVLWVSSAGKLTIGTRAQFLAQTGGTVVGSQS